MRSPPGFQEEELIIYDEDIGNLENIPLVTSMEIQSELVESKDQNSEEPAISFVDMSFESALATSSSTLKTSAFPKQTSESNEVFQRLPHDYIVPSKLSLKMSQNIDTKEHSINEFIEFFSPYTTENDTVKPEFSFDLRTPYIFYVDTDTTASNSSSATKKSGSINPFTQKYKKSVKIRTYRNPDGSVTEEKKIVEHNLTSSKGNVDKSALYSSDEDDMKFDDKYFDSMFNEMPSEFVEDDFNFVANKKKRINCGSCSRKTKSEKIQIREPMADLQLKTSISSKVVSPKAENVSNESHWSVSYAHSDIKQSRPGKEFCKEIEKVIQYNKSSDTTLISRKCKSEKINTNSPVANTQLKTSISNKVVSSKIENENDDVPLRSILNDIKLNSEKSRKGIEKEIQLEINDRDVQKSSIDTIRSKSVNKKDNIVTRSTSIDEIPIKNEATITDQSNMSETTQILELKRKIKEEFDKLISRTGKKPGQTHFDKFCRKIYEKHGIQLKQIQPNMHDSKKPLEQKPNDIEGIEANAFKNSEREIQVLQEILNRIKLRTKVDVKEEQYNSDSNNKIEPKSEDATSSVRESLEQYGNKLLNAMEYIKEGVINMFSRENSKHSARIEKSSNGVINKPDNIKTREKKASGSTDIEEKYKGGNVKSHGVKILDSSLSEDSIIKTAVEKFNKRGIQIWDSEDDLEGVVQSAISKFNEEQRRPENMKENRPKKREDPKTTFKEKQSKPKEQEKKPMFVIKEIEIVDKHISTKIIPESTTQKELRAFRSSHPDKTTTDSDVTSKSEGYTGEQVIHQRTDNSKGEVTMLNDTFAADEEKLDEKRKTVRSEQDKKSVSIPESETSTKSHFKGKITRIKQKGRPDKVELQSVYKEVSTSSQVSEASKLASKQSSSVRKDGNVFVTKQEESKDDGVSVIKQEESKDDNISVTVEKESKDDNVSLTKQKNSKVDSAIDLKQTKAESEECKRKIIICEKCLMALSGFIPAKIVEETKVSADCQLCCLKEKQKEALKMPICSDFVIAEEDSSFSSSSDSCCKDTWSEKYPCCIPYKDQKLVAFHDTSYNKILESKVNDKFVTTPNPSTFIPGKPGVSTSPTEPKVATVPTASSEHSFAEMLVKSFARLLGVEQYRKQEPEKQTMESPCQSQEICDSYESETSDTPCPNKCTREAATSTKTSTRYDVRRLRDLPPFKKGPVKNDSGCSKCIDSDIALDIARTKDVLLGLESSDSLENSLNKNKNTHTEIIYSKYVCKNKKK